MITMIAAAAENNALGKDNGLVWHLPDDFKRFKKLTMGHPIIMGRKTFDSFDKLLPGRTHIVVTRQTDYHPEGAVVVNNLIDAIAIAKEEDDDVFIIGGGEIYTQGMDHATHIEITRVHGVFEADTFFPKIDGSQWKLISKQFHDKDERHDYAFTYLTYAREET